MLPAIFNTVATAFADFQTRITAAQRLCVLKNLTYENGHVPDYSLPIVRQYYMLRYFPAYWHSMAKRRIKQPDYAWQPRRRPLVVLSDQGPPQAISTSFFGLPGRDW